MENKPQANRDASLPACATEFIRRVVRRMWYRRRAQRDVQAELTAHFEDAVRDCATAEEKECRARELIAGFGDARLLASLCHRAKKRCRPLWLKALLRSGQGLGLVLLYCVVCTLPLFLARPTIRVNYGEWLSNHWRPEAPGVENAKTYYEEAAKLLIEPPPGLEEKMRLRRWSSVGYSDSDVRLIEEWLAQNQGAFSALRRGANTPQYWPTYDSNECYSSASRPLQASLATAEVETPLPLAWRDMTFALKQQIIWEAKRGEVAKALDDCLVLRRTGRHLQNKGSLPGQMAGIAIEFLSYDGIITFLSNADFSPGVLEHVQKELLASFDPGRQVIGLDCEKTLWYDEIQRTFTDDGKGGGHASATGLFYASGDWKGNLLNTFRFHYPDRRQTIAMVDRYFRWAQECLNTLPDARRLGEPNDLSRAPTANPVLSILTPAYYERLALMGWQLKTHEAATITLLAIQRYFCDRGSYPDRLDQLVEQGFLKMPPKDPFGPGPLTYRKPDSGFLLYSWGADRQDDVGQLGTDSQGQPRNWADNGDWVFWPVAP